LDHLKMFDPFTWIFIRHGIKTSSEQLDVQS
jgi:hypothetical protein